MRKIVSKMAQSLNKNSFITLSSGYNMPIIGLGTYLVSPEEVKLPIKYALEFGYRHIDTATIYGNEAQIGEAIRESGINRKDIFITTKLRPADQGYDNAIAACNLSLKNLGVDYVDLYLIHWPGVIGVKRDSPQNRIIRNESWRALESLVAEGKCKSIGVSNYTIAHLEDLLTKGRHHIVPAVNQVEFHPLLNQNELLNYCKSKGIILEAYSSFGGEDGVATLLSESKVIQIAQSHKKSPAQVLLRWALQKNAIIIPKSIKRERIKENIEIFDFELTIQEEVLLDSINANKRFCWDPEYVA